MKQDNGNFSIGQLIIRCGYRVPPLSSSIRCFGDLNMLRSAAFRDHVGMCM